MDWTSGKAFICAVAMLLGQADCFELFRVVQNPRIQRRSVLDNQKCTPEEMSAAKLTYGTKVHSEFQEDELMSFMKMCSDTVKAANYCLLGPEAVLDGHINNEVAFVFILEDFDGCVELFGKVGSTDHHIRVVDQKHIVTGGYIELGGTNYTLLTSGPYFPFMAGYTGIKLPPIYLLSNCILDEYNYRTLMSCGSVFGLKKKAINRGSIIAPEKTSHCTQHDIVDALASHAKILAPREEDLIVGILIQTVLPRPTTEAPKYLMGNVTILPTCECDEVEQATNLSRDSSVVATAGTSNVIVVSSLLTIITILILVISLQIVIMVKLLKKASDPGIELD